MTARKLANYPPQYAALFRRAHAGETVRVECISADEARRVRFRLYQFKHAHLDDPTFDPYIALAAAELRFTLDGATLSITRCRPRLSTQRSNHDA